MNLPRSIETQLPPITVTLTREEFDNIINVLNAYRYLFPIRNRTLEHQMEVERIDDAYIALNKNRNW